MKPLFTVLASAGLVTAGLLTAGCGTGPAGSLGSVPSGPASNGTASSGAASPAPAGSATAPSPGGTQPSSGSASPSPAPTGRASLQAWFTKGGKLFVTERSVPATTAVATAAIGAVLAGPSAAERAAGLGSRIPPGTALLGVRIARGIATVDLSSSFLSSAGGPMPARIAQVVYTATQFPTVRGVRFSINGQSPTVLGGVPVQDPQTRAMYAGFLPAITVQSPVIGEQVSSPVTVTGTADVFEATVSVRVLDAAGHEIARTFTTATCGTGCRGDYSVALAYSVPRTQRGVIEVFESSARNGQPVHVQRIPVTLTA
ncbi:MAG TPA: Gmad2 immunoglobulin-like domain-containing protein [Streptosporangiaceae bacterium]